MRLAPLITVISLIPSEERDNGEDNDELGLITDDTGADEDDKELEEDNNLEGTPFP